MHTNHISQHCSPGEQINEIVQLFSETGIIKEVLQPYRTAIVHCINSFSADVKITSRCYLEEKQREKLVANMNHL